MRLRPSRLTWTVALAVATVAVGCTETPPGTSSTEAAAPSQSPPKLKKLAPGQKKTFETRRQMAPGID
jgi:hypothetical protein